MSQYIIRKDLSRKVLMVGNYYKNHHPGGISAVVAYWSRYIERLQYYPTFKEGGIIGKLWWFGSSYVRVCIRMLLDPKIEIVHSHTAADTDFKRQTMMVNLAKRFRKKVVLHSHASRFKDFYVEASSKKKMQILSTLRKADVLVVLSESWRKWFAGIGVDPAKITILHNITDFPTIAETANASKNIDVQKRSVHFLFMGEIGKRKGVFDIIRGLSKHHNEVAGQIQFRIGGNKMEDELRKAIVEGNLSDCVKFEGWVSGEKKIELLNWADVFILPSYNEGLPISILEAMSYKMPIISTPVGGIPEVVDETNGIIVSPGDDEEIFSAMMHYVNNKIDIAVQGEESECKAKTYLPDYVLLHLKQIYEELLK